MSKKYSEEWYHNKGQSDGSEGKYDSPRHNIFQTFSSSDSEIEHNESVSDAYTAGYENGSKRN